MSPTCPDLFLTGAGGFIGSRIREVARARGMAIASSGDGLGRLALEEAGAMSALIATLRPRLIIHAAAIADIAACEAEAERATRVNVAASLEIAEAAAAQGARLVFLSTDQVFDGESAPYDESALPAPLHHYGRTKVLAEQGILARSVDSLVLRLPLVIGRSRGRRRSASDSLLDAAREGRRLGLFEDEYRSPAEVGDLATALLDLALLDQLGLLHLGGPERLSRWEIGVLVARQAGLDPGTFLDRTRRIDHRLAALRPADLELDSRRAEKALGRALRPLAAAIT